MCNMSRRQALGVTAGVILGLAAAGTVTAQDYPMKKIEMIVMWRAGGGADIASRVFAKHLEKILQTDIIVQNIAGAGGALGYAAAKQAKPDGYTLVTIQGDLPKYELKGLAPIAIDDFDILAGTAYQSPIIAVRSDAPWNTLQEFVSALKAKPGGYSIAINDIGGNQHQSMVLWADAAGVDPAPVTFEGSPQQTAALLGGHVDAAFTWVKATAPYVEEGKLKFLGYMGSERLPSYPDVPTFIELGYDAVWEHPYGIGGPKGMPEDVRKVIQDAAAQIWANAEFQSEMEKLGLTVLRKDGDAYHEHLLKLQNDMKRAFELIGQ